MDMLGISGNENSMRKISGEVEKQKMCLQIING